MEETAQRRAVARYRDRLSAQGLARFEVVGRAVDRQLLRELARALAGRGAEATSLRAALSQAAAGAQPPRGGIVAALRRSPLVGADIAVVRSRTRGRKVDL